ncbi:hypothetical protein F4604DRAFT_1930477 [Suillus subluteus]|nr:hypothetical protein F4604DRAFT_1930477 [Suillus subluteus]
MPTSLVFIAKPLSASISLLENLLPCLTSHLNKHQMSSVSGFMLSATSGWLSDKETRNPPRHNRLQDTCRRLVKVDGEIYSLFYWLMDSTTAVNVSAEENRMTQTPHDEDTDVFGRQSSPPSRYDHSSLGFPPSNAAFPLAGDNFIFPQFGGGCHYEDPARGTLESSKVPPLDDDSAVTTHSGHHPSPFTGEGASFTPMLNTGSSHHPSPFTGDISSRTPAPAPIQDMFYGLTRDQPAWAGQQGSDMFGLLGADSFTDLIGDQDLNSSAFDQGFSGHVAPFDLQRPSHLPQASLAPPPSTNINPPTPDTHIPTPGLPQPSLAPPPSTNVIPPTPHARIPTPGPSQRLDLSHYSPATISSEWFPEECLTSHSEEPPVVGRRSAETNAALDAGFAAVDQTLLELSRTTGMPMHQNLYSNYFKDNTKQELGRLGQNLAVGEHTPSVTRQKECYAKFKEQFPDTYQDILDTHEELASLGALPQTIGQRRQAFQRFHRRVTNILDVVSSKFGFESATVMCGKIVNQDASLSHVHTTPGVTDFFLTRCRADNDTIIGHLKAQVYNTVSLSTIEDAFAEPGDDDIVSLKDAGSKDPDSRDMEDDQASQASDLPEGREEKGREDNIKWIKREIMKQVAKFGGKFGTDRVFPWKLMPSALADNNICIKGYPAHKCLLPGEARDTTSNSKSKGVASLTQKEVLILMDSLKSKMMYVEKVDASKRAAVMSSQQPVIIGEAPPSDYSHTGARRLFIDGHIDYNGPSRIQVSAATTKVKKSTTSAAKSTTSVEVLVPPPSRPFKVVARPGPPPSRPFKVVPKPPAHEVIELSTSPDSRDANDQHNSATDSEYEEASQGKRKKRKSSGEPPAPKKHALPVDILPKTAMPAGPSEEKSGPSSQHANASPTKGGPLSPLTVESSSTEEQDLVLPAPTKLSVFVTALQASLEKQKAELEHDHL